MTTTFSYPCGRCGQRHDFDAEQAGAWVSCEQCDAEFQLPVPRAAARAATPVASPGRPAAPADGPSSESRRTSAPAPGHVKFPCGICNQRYEVPANLAGRRFKCKKCGAGLTVPWVGQPAEGPPAPPSTSHPPTPPRPSLPIAEAPAARPAPASAPRIAAQASNGFARQAPTRPAPPESAAPVFAYTEVDAEVEVEEVAPAFAFIEEDERGPAKSRASDPYGLDEGEPAPRAGAGARSQSEYVLPQRVSPSKSKKKAKGKSNAGKFWAVGGSVGGGVGVVVFFIVKVAMRLALSGGLGLGNDFASNEARLDKAHEEYIGAFHQLLDVLGSVHDVPSAMQADPKARALIQQMGASNRSAMGTRVSLEYAAKLKTRAQHEAQFEGPRLVAQLMRVRMIPGVQPAMQGTFNELEQLARIEQQGMRNMGIQ